MNTDFFDKLKKDTLLVSVKPKQLHVIKLVEDYRKDSDTTGVLLAYRFGVLYPNTGRIFNARLKREENREHLYIVTEEF